MSKDELEVVTNMLKQIGPTLSKAESQMIASIAEGSGTLITNNDAKVIFDMMEQLGEQSVKEPELEILAVLTKSEPEPMPLKEAQMVARVVAQTSGMNEVEAKKSKIKEVVESGLSQHEAHVMTEILAQVPADKVD